jgi:2-dehydro-3-deoxygluconokinase
MIKERRTSETTRVLYYRAGSAGSRLSPTDLAGARVPDAALLHVTGITPALSPTASDAVFAAIDLAADSGVPISFDVNHRATLWRDRDAVDAYSRITAAAAVVFAGLDEARLLLGADVGASLGAADAARAIADLGPTQVIVKLGAAGCVALIDGVVHEVPAVEVNAVDTVGAGDAFVAGYLAELLAGLPAEARLATAVITGAFACLHPGDWEGFPRREDFGLLDPADPVIR